MKNRLLKNKYTVGYSSPLNTASCGKQQRIESQAIQQLSFEMLIEVNKTFFFSAPVDLKITCANRMHQVSWSPTGSHQEFFIYFKYFNKYVCNKCQKFEIFFPYLSTVLYHFNITVLQMLYYNIPSKHMLHSSFQGLDLQPSLSLVQFIPTVNTWLHSESIQTLKSSNLHPLEIITAKLLACLFLLILHV